MVLISQKCLKKYAQLFLIVKSLVITTHTQRPFSFLPISVSIRYISLPIMQLCRPVCDDLLAHDSKIRKAVQVGTGVAQSVQQH